MPPRPKRRLLEPPPPEPDDAEPVDPLEVRSIIERQGGRFKVELHAAGHRMRSIIEQHGARQWPRPLVCDITLADSEDGHQIVRRLRQLEA